MISLTAHTQRWLIYPFKLLTVGFHEFSHAIAGKLTGAKIESIRLDPHEGGETRMRGGWSFLTLPAGYLGSSLSGSLRLCLFERVPDDVSLKLVLSLSRLDLIALHPK